MTTSLPHDECVARLSEYIDGGLSHDEAASIASHLEACESCRVIAHDLKTLIARLRADPVDAPATDGWPRVARDLTIDRRGRAPFLIAHSDAGGNRGRRTVWSLAAAAVFVTVFAGGVWLGPALMTSTRRVARRTIPAPLDSAYRTEVRRALDAVDRALAAAERDLANNPHDAFLTEYVAELHVLQDRERRALLRDSVP